MRAARAPSPMRIDGKLDEPAYAAVPPIDDFIQMEPAGGQPATEKTEVWLFFDERNVYVTMRAWESQPDRMIANEMRRDSNNIRRATASGSRSTRSTIGRNAFQFEVNPLGARTDGQSTNERQYNGDWNPVWDLAVGRVRRRVDGRGGDSVQVAALPARPRADWGFNARRNNKWKNEIAVSHPHSAGMRHRPRQLRGVAVSPRWSVSKRRRARRTSRSSRTRSPTSDDRSRRLAARSSNDLDGDVGVDVKYGVTQNLTADFTYNTDFAQVEADEQQVNLTRFSLFFPEKREFFLENQGMFAFGGVGGERSAAAERRHADAVLQPPHRPQSGAAKCRSSAAGA